MREDAVSAYSRTHEKHALKERETEREREKHALKAAGGDLLDGGEAAVKLNLYATD
jgi:hypothetical protein